MLGNRRGVEGKGTAQKATAIERNFAETLDRYQKTLFICRDQNNLYVCLCLCVSEGFLASSELLFPGFYVHLTLFRLPEHNEFGK